MKQLTSKIWITDFEEERDRPALGYIEGRNYSLAIDAGHSKEHVDEFYAQLKKEGLPLPDYTIITHWHWDHTFGMHAVSGIAFAEQRTQNYLSSIIQEWTSESQKKYMEMDKHINQEYLHQQMNVVMAKQTFHDQIEIDLGDIHAHAFHVPSPHTDDSVLILIPEEKVLFVGDCICGAYPEWKVDSALMQKLIQCIEHLDFNLAVGGHWPPMTKAELIQFLVDQ